jgi:dolichyldiphosphatase
MQNTLKSISLTHVQYSQGDLVGKVLGYITLLPIAIIVGFVTLIIFNRNLKTFYYFVGLLLNEAINFSLKRVIREPRPSDLLGDGTFGMPSSHSQLAWYFVTFAIIHVYIYNAPLKLAGLENLLIPGLTIMAGGISYSRVYLHYHTLEQVIVGALVGVFVGWIWFSLQESLVKYLANLLIKSNINKIARFDIEMKKTK